MNAIKLLVSFYWSRVNKNIQPWGFPMTMSVEPTTACNLGCPECPSGLKSFTRPTGTLSPELFHATIDQANRHLLYLIFYFQGEPYINPSFLEMVKYANDKGIYTITSTNGHFLNDKNAEATVRSGLDRLIISLDGTTQEVYEQYRVNGSLENVIQGTKNIIKWKHRLGTNHPHVIFQFLVVAPNEHQIVEVQKLADSLGVDEVKYKSAQLYDYKDGHHLMPSIQKYSRYIETGDGTFKVKHSIKNECWKLWHATLMTWDGKILPCCFDKDARHELGNIADTSLHQIWKSDKYRSFRESLYMGRDKIDICQNCSEGCKVWV